MKIEDKPISAHIKTNKDFYREFLTALRDIKKDQSFVIEGLSSNHRNILSACRVLLRKTFIVRAEGESKRVYCLNDSLED